LHYLCAQRDAEAADLFFLQLADGVGLKVTDPQYQVREYLMKQKAKRARSPLTDRVIAVAKAWNLWRAGKAATRQAITWTASKDKSPEIK